MGLPAIDNGSCGTIGQGHRPAGSLLIESFFPDRVRGPFTCAWPVLRTLRRRRRRGLGRLPDIRGPLHFRRSGDAWSLVTPSGIVAGSWRPGIRRYSIRQQLIGAVRRATESRVGLSRASIVGNQRCKIRCTILNLAPSQRVDELALGSAGGCERRGKRAGLTSRRQIIPAIEVLVQIGEEHESKEQKDEGDLQCALLIPVRAPQFQVRKLRAMIVRKSKSRGKQLENLIDIAKDGQLIIRQGDRSTDAGL